MSCGIIAVSSLHEVITRPKTQRSQVEFCEPHDDLKEIL